MDASTPRVTPANSAMLSIPVHARINSISHWLQMIWDDTRAAGAFRRFKQKTVWLVTASINVVFNIEISANKK
jgi:hypothetical protein